MNISFIVPLLNEESTIRLCIDSIIAEIGSDDEIIVVDNGSVDGSIDKIRSLQNVTIIYKLNASIGSVRNAGAAIAEKDVLAFVDADCVLCPGWRANVARTLQNENVSITGSKVDIPDDAKWVERAWYSQRDSKNSLVSYINSGNLIVRKKVFYEVGCFSETLITGEDSEFCWRARWAGNKILSNPAIKSIHLGNPKNLSSFYGKEKWHALGMMGTFKISWVNKPLIMTGVHVLCNLFAIIYLVFFMGKTHLTDAVFTFLFLSLLVPVVTAVYRSIQFKKIRYLVHLTVLYWVYYLARSNVMFRILLNKN